MFGQRKAGRRAAAIGVGVLLVASGCRTDRELTEPDPLPITEKRLLNALLTIDDLPETFTEVAEATQITAELTPEHECDDALADLEPREVASADFTSDGRVLNNAIAWFPGGGAAVDQLYRDIAADCAAVVVADADLSLRTSALDFGVLSDNTLALKVEAELADGRIEERDLILMRQGDLIGIVRLTGPRPSDKVLLDSVVRVAIGRLGQLSDDTS
ncbi:MAG: hypothetical protein ABL966_01045 [Acidimicrobiales bacterium]